ncbi:Uncharacterised protein [Streptococcus pneumoniae]|nr:Uncharacterised protein [Streptococcus pneumoniae]
MLVSHELQAQQGLHLLVAYSQASHELLVRLFQLQLLRVRLVVLLVPLFQPQQLLVTLVVLPVPLFQPQQLLVTLVVLPVPLFQLQQLLVTLAELLVRLCRSQLWVAQLEKQFYHQAPSNQHICNQKFATHHHVQTHGC